MKYILLITLLFSNLIFAKKSNEMFSFENPSNPWLEEKKITEYTPLAKQGDSEAQYLLGYMYDNGRGITRDLKKAAYWYTLAANQDHKMALYELGDMYGEGKGVKKDLKKAIYLIKRSEKIEREEPLKFKYPGSWFMYSANTYDKAHKYELELEESKHWFTKIKNRLYGVYTD